MSSKRVAWRLGLALAVAALAAWLGVPLRGPDTTRPPATAASPGCLGESRPLRVANHMPYAEVAIGTQRGWFVLDYGATLSTITPSGFGSAGTPRPAAGTADQYDGFDFFGPWDRVRLALQAAPPQVPGLTQAGVLGTDFLAAHVYTLDYAAGRLHRAQAGSACSDADFVAAGFVALPTQGYFSNQAAALTCPGAGGPGRCVNVPTVPIRIGPVQAIAQIDTGYDDSRQGRSININTALFDQLRRAGVPLVARPDISLQLSTCAGVAEPVEAWQLAPGTAFGFVDTTGASHDPVEPGGPITLFLKRTPAAAAVCGGIGTWAQPAAQLGASFVAGGAMVVDPFSARVWLR